MRCRVKCGTSTRNGDTTPEMTDTLIAPISFHTRIQARYPHPHTVDSSVKHSCYDIADTGVGSGGMQGI